MNKDLFTHEKLKGMHNGMHKGVHTVHTPSRIKVVLSDVMLFFSQTMSNSSHFFVL